MTLLALLWLGACASRQPFYEPAGSWAVVVDPLDQDFFAGLVQEDLRRGRIEGIELLGDSQPERVRPGNLKDLPTPVLYALHLCGSRRARGGEFDLLVHTDGPVSIVPVTVWSSPTGMLQVAQGTRPPRAGSPPAHGDLDLWKRELAATFHLVDIEDAGSAWSSEELAHLETALSLLSPAERLAVQGLLFGREASSRRMPGRELAYYDPRRNPPRIDVFDVGFHGFWSGFVGPVDAPIAAPVMTLLHEIGHALADLPLRQAWDRFVALDQDWREASDPEKIEALAQARKEARREMRRLGLDGPVIQDYRQVRGPRRGPTSWAWRQAHESFAEAFALYHLDPDALRRALPAVHDWFADGGHVAWMDDSREAPLRARQSP